MKKALFLFCVFLVSAAILAPPPTPQTQIVQQQPQIPPISPPVQEPPKITVKEASQSIKSEDLKKYVTYLASAKFDGRGTGTQGNRDAAEYIKRFFERCGLKTQFQEFPSSRGNSQNIIAHIPGTSRKNEILVVGGHMDHLGRNHPGADDNASGTAGVMAIAKAFSKVSEKPKRTIVFQCYSGEELGLVGSNYYVNHPLFPIGAPDIRKHVFMINLDMIGYYKGQQQVFSSGSGTGGSDHASFRGKGVPTAFFHTGLHPNYHTPQDTPEKLNYEGMQKIVRMAFEMAWDYGQGANPKEYCSAELTKFEPTHDHDEVPFIK